MAKKYKSQFNQMLTLVRRIIVLTIAAIGLAKEWPYDAVVVRTLGLWAVLYICSLSIELVLQHLSYQAMKAENKSSPNSKSTRGESTGVNPAI